MINQIKNKIKSLFHAEDKPKDQCPSCGSETCLVVDYQRNKVTGCSSCDYGKEWW